jgi:hypothetical protein
MATQITSNQIDSELGQRRRTIGGKLAANRQLRGVAIIGALVLALAASLAIGRAFGSDQAGSAVSLPSVGDGAGFTAYREDHGAAATTLVPGFTEMREVHRISATVAEPGFTSFREDYRQSATVAEPGFTSFREDYLVPVAVTAPGFTDYREDHRSNGASGLPGFTETREDHRAPSDAPLPTRWGPGEDY